MVSTAPSNLDDSSTEGDDDEEDTIDTFDIHAPEVRRAQCPPTVVGQTVSTLLPIPRFHKSRLVPAGAIGVIKAIAPLPGMMFHQHALVQIKVVWASVDFGPYGRACAPAMYLESICV